MREENYFKIKLETSRETLSNAERRLENLDIQINLLELRFEHDKKIYNDRVEHEQKIVSGMEKRIPELEKKIAQGYTTIDMRTGKAFKSFDERHKGLLKDKIKATEELQKAVVEKYKKRQALKGKNKKKLSLKDLDVVEAQEVREEAQPEDELEEVKEKEIERLKLKEEFYRKELERLKNAPKNVEKKEVKFDSNGNEVLKDLLNELTTPEEPEVEIPIPKDEHEGKVQCPECKEWFTKGGAFARHYQSHVNGD
jgi:hypothetical protein